MNELWHDIVESIRALGVIAPILLGVGIVIALCIIIALVRGAHGRLVPLTVVSFLPSLGGLCCTIYGYTVATKRIQAQLAVFGQDGDELFQALHPAWRSSANMGAWLTIFLLLLCAVWQVLARRAKHWTHNNNLHPIPNRADAVREG